MEALAIGLGLGLAAGVSPGPLLVLVVTATLRGGLLPGLVTACAPLLSDALVVALTLTVLTQLPDRALGVLALAGACFIAWTGVTTVREARTATVQIDAEQPGAAFAALRRAATVNLLSPHPWVFWATVLGPLTVAAWRTDPASGVALVLGFYLTIVGAKAVVAVIVSRTRGRLSDRGYRTTLVVAGVLLVVTAVAVVVEFAPAVA